MKTEILSKFWKAYKANFGTENFKKSEEYKWGLFKDMYTIWNWRKDESNQEMYKQTFLVNGPKNLWQSGNFYPTSMLNWIWEIFPADAEIAFSLLFDETIELTKRIDEFNSILIDKLPELAKLTEDKPVNHHYHGDLRAISIYLSLQFPEKYFLYKHTMFKDFSVALKLPTVTTGRDSNYLDYITICNEIRDFISQDTDFISVYNKYLTDKNLYLDPYLHLLVQDFVLSIATLPTSYWVFQGNPSKYDFENALKQGSLNDWTASAHRQDFRIGDKVIFWLSGKKAGCFALGEITDEPYELENYVDENWKVDQNSKWKVGIKISHNLWANPIYKDVIDISPELANLNTGLQGSNFKATKDEYDCFLDIINSRKTGAYNKIKKALDKDKLNVFISILKKFTAEHHLKENDPRISFNIRERHSRLVFVIGSRYSLCIEKIKKETILSFISEHDITNTTEVPFKSKKGEVEAYWNHFNFDRQEEFEKLVFEGLDSELQRNHQCNYKTFSNHEFAVDILGESKLKYWLYAPGENASMWEDFYRDGIMGLGWDELGDLTSYESKDDITSRLKELGDDDSSKKNDASANLDFKENISVGDIVIAKKGRSAYLGYGEVVSDYYFDDLAQNYKHRRKVNWNKKGLWYSEHQIVLKTLTDITNLPYKPNPSLLAPQAILKIINGPNSEEMNHQPLNQILYGPPGTGKTFKLKNEYFSKYTTSESTLTPEQHFVKIVSDCSWWQVIAIALIQDGKSKVSAIAENKWVKQKAELSNSNTIRPTLWSQLQSHTIETCEFVNVKNKQQPFIFNKTEDSFWEILQDETTENAPELFELIDSVENFKPSADKVIERYVFTTFHQGYSYEDFIEGIKPVLEGNDGQLTYQIEDGIFKRLCNRAAADPINKYAIFIDEINRGNVSAIFGELITLIEADKRKDASNELRAILPYSKRTFVVPSNIDIYGTMNTADRSVEALDTALRRRFSFVEMLPNPERLKDKGEDKNGNVGSINLPELLSVINDRIEVLVDRDHTIGHAFFMDVKSIEDLKHVFADKIIPLLQEYFYGNYAKMEMVLGPNFFDEKNGNKPIQFAVQNNNIEVSETNYKLKNIHDDSFDLEKALKRLLNTSDPEVEKAN